MACKPINTGSIPVIGSNDYAIHASTQAKTNINRKGVQASV
jgi:hypothetical protein